MNEKSIYPKIYHLLLENENSHERLLRLETYLRVKHRGKYYLWRFYRQTEFKPNLAYPGGELIEAITLFIAEIYRVQLFGKVNPNLIQNDNGINRPVFELDPDQRSEAERLNPVKDLLK